MLYIESQVDEALKQGKKSISHIFTWLSVLLPVLFIGFILLPNNNPNNYRGVWFITSIVTCISLAFWLGKHKKRNWKHWVLENFQDPRTLYLIERRAIENGWGMFENLTPLKSPKQAITHIKPCPSLPQKTVFGKNKKKVKQQIITSFAIWLMVMLMTLSTFYFEGQQTQQIVFSIIIINLAYTGMASFVCIRNYRIYKSFQNLLEISAQGIWSKSRKKLGIISWEHIKQFAFHSPTGSNTNYHIYLIFTPAYAQSISKKQLYIDTQLIELPKDKQNLETLFNQYQYLYWHKTPVSDEQ